MGGGKFVFTDFFVILQLHLPIRYSWLTILIATE